MKEQDKHEKYVEEEYVMNKKQKLEHFWEYYRIHTMIVIFILFLIAITVKDFVSKEKPDYTIGLLSSKYITEDVLESLEQEIEKYALDINDDGEVVVAVNNYYINYDAESSDADTLTANTMLLYADLSSREDSFIYIVDGLNDFSNLLEYAFVGEDGEYLTAFDKTGIVVDENLYGTAILDINALQGIDGFSERFADSRVVIVSEENYEEDNDSVKQAYQNDLNLYNILINS